MKSVFTTHVGSLPFKHVDKALEYTFLFDLPVLFSLPGIDENQFMGRDIVSLLKIGEYTDAHTIKLNENFLESELELEPPYLDEFSKKFKETSHKAFKHQFIGPFSFFKLIENKEISFEQVSKFLLKKYSNLLIKLTRVGDCIFMLDEPLLGKASGKEIEILNDFIKQLSRVSNCEVGVHVCCKLSIDQIKAISCKHLNLDLSLYLSKEIVSFPPISFIGLSDGLMDSQDLLGILSGKNNVKSYICPSCGLFFKKEDVLVSIFNNLTTTKEQILTKILQ